MCCGLSCSWMLENRFSATGVNDGVCLLDSTSPNTHGSTVGFISLDSICMIATGRVTHQTCNSVRKHHLAHAAAVFTAYS